MTPSTHILAAVFLTAVLAVWAVVVRRGSDESRLASTVLRQFFLTIALPVAASMGLLLLILAAFVTLDERIWQALIAGLFIATGWLTTAVFEALAKRRDRAGRTRDYHKALYAEIGTALDTLYDGGEGEAYAARTLERMRADPDFVPFVPREQHDHIYNAILQSIEVLPRQTIDAIVAYYAQMKSIAALTEDMRGTRFRSASMDQSRRIAIYSDYLEMRQQAFDFGQHALRLIKVYSEGGAPAAQAVIDAVSRVSSPDAARSGPSRGSE